MVLDLCCDVGCDVGGNYNNSVTMGFIHYKALVGLEARPTLTNSPAEGYNDPTGALVGR
jgi:hypothetical protein